MIDVERTKILLDEIFPARGPTVSLEKGAPWGEMTDWVTYDATHGLRVILRLIVFDPEDAHGNRSIRDIKEQQCQMIPPAAGDVPFERVEAYLRGWVDAVADVFSKSTAIDTLMPHDLTAPSVLKVKKATTAETFREALLVKSRLGRLVPA